MSGFEQVRFFSDAAFQYGDLISATWAAHISVAVGAVGFGLSTRGARGRGLAAGWCLLLGLVLLAFDAVNLVSLGVLYEKAALSAALSTEAWARSGLALTPEIERVLAGPRQDSALLFVLGRPVERIVAVTAALDTVVALATGLLLSRAGRRR